MVFQNPFRGIGSIQRNPARQQTGRMELYVDWMEASPRVEVMINGMAGVGAVRAETNVSIVLTLSDAEALLRELAFAIAECKTHHGIAP